MSTDTANVLAHYRAVDDHAEANPSHGGSTNAASLRITSRDLGQGRVRISMSVVKEVHRLRGSGKSFHYTEPVMGLSILRTKRDLVVLQELSAAFGRNSTTHLFADDVNTIKHKLCMLLARFNHALDTAAERRFVIGDPEEVPARRERFAADHPTVERLTEQILTLLGELPDVHQRFPMLTHHELHRLALRMSGQLYFLDATDHRQVAAAAFGVTRCRRDLTKAVERWSGQERGLEMLNWFRLFRGLVPVDWIVKAMNDTPLETRLMLGALYLDHARQILRRLPQPVLRRILEEPFPQIRQIVVDTAMYAPSRDLDQLPALIAARGQRRVRGMQDVENLVMAIPEKPRAANTSARVGQMLIAERHLASTIQAYNEAFAPAAAPTTWEQWKDPAFREQAEQLMAQHRNELLAAEQRARAAQEEKRRQERAAKEAKRAAWAKETTKKLHDLTVGAHRIVVAKDAQTLTQWGASLNNCIGSYACDLGLDVFAAVVDAEDTVRLNIQITQADGITQFLGTNNRDAATVLPVQEAQTILNALTAQGIGVGEWAIGLKGLEQPRTQALVQQRVQLTG